MFDVFEMLLLTHLTQAIVITWCPLLAASSINVYILIFFLQSTGTIRTKLSMNVH